MGGRLMESQAQFSFHLDGNSEIDANILSNIIGDMAKLAKLTAQNIEPDAYLKMNVTAFQNGSFQIDFSAVCEAATGIWSFVAGTVPVAGKIVDAIKGCFEIKKLLKGQSPKKVVDKTDKTIEVENNAGEKITVPKASAIVIHNSNIDQLIVNISNSALEHNSDGGFSITDSQKEEYYTIEDVKSLSLPLPIEDTVLCKRYRLEATLPIRKPDFIGHSKWGFTYKDKMIEARIYDEGFLEQVHSGMTIKNGDFITSTLEICVDLNESGQPIPGTEKYSVIKVHGSIQHSPTQLSIPNI